MNFDRCAILTSLLPPPAALRCRCPAASDKKLHRLENKAVFLCLHCTFHPTVTVTFMFYPFKPKLLLLLLPTVVVTVKSVSAQAARLYFLFVSVVVTFTFYPLKPRGLFLCPERQRKQSALRECRRVAVAVNFSALRLLYK